VPETVGEVDGGDADDPEAVGWLVPAPTEEVDEAATDVELQDTGGSTPDPCKACWLGDLVVKFGLGEIVVVNILCLLIRTEFSSSLRSGDGGKGVTGESVAEEVGDGFEEEEGELCDVALLPLLPRLLLPFLFDFFSLFFLLELDSAPPPVFPPPLPPLLDSSFEGKSPIFFFFFFNL